MAAAAAFHLVRPTPDRDGTSSTAEAAPGPDLGHDGRPAAAATLVRALATRLEHGTRAQVVALGAGAQARGELATVLHNVRALHLTDLSMSYVGADAGRRPASGTGDAVGRTWTGDVQVSWRLRGFDVHPARMRVPMTFAEHDAAARARFVTARHARTGGRDAVPLWLLDRVKAVRTGRSLVVGERGLPTARYSRLAGRAVADVRRVLPDWSGRLVVEVPDGPADLARTLGSEPSDYTQIAAVTTTEDGSTREAAPVHIFVNPQVFDPLGPHGAQVVMSHEATHVATGAALSSMPPWLLEGFADYVALDHLGLPVQVTASQVLARVRAHGPPSQLPSRADFGAHRRGLGAAYESAWLACRLIGETYGEPRLVRFYRAVDRGSSTSRAFRSVLGTDERAFTDAWRRELRRLAG